MNSAHVDMQRYQWPGYDMQLLGELQRQQINTQFCDTLLQTEGISVPAHSCILAALSPYLSQKLAASPSPPSGQKRQLQLQGVRAQTLLKLVGLLYSGELELKGSVEQNDVLSAVHQFGITVLVEGQKDGTKDNGKEGRESNKRRKMQDAQVQSDIPVGGARDSQIKKRSCKSTGTQTITAGEKAVGSSLTDSSHTRAPTQESASSLPLQPQNTTFDKHSCSPSFPPIPSMPSGESSDGESTFVQSSDSVTNPTSTSTLSSDIMTYPFSINDDLNSPTPQEYSTSQQSSVGKTNGKMADSRENTEQLSLPTLRDEMQEGGKGNVTQNRHANANVRMRSLAKMKQMQQMMEATQISIKVKLRRRTKGEVWEVVNIQDTDETLAVLASQKQDCSNHKGPQTDLTNSETPPSSVQPGSIPKLVNPVLQPATTNSSEPLPPHPNTTSCDCLTLNRSNGLDSVPLPQPPGSVDESDEEQIEKLLEDIMMGLNILPNLERDFKKSHHLQPSHNQAPATYQIPLTECDEVHSQMHAGVSAEGGVCDHDFGTQIGLSSADTDGNQPSFSRLSSDQQEAVTTQQQCSPHCHSPVTSMGHRDGPSYQGMLPSKSKNPKHEVHTTTSVKSTAVFSSGPTLHYSECQEQSLQEDQNILELPLTIGNQAQSLHSCSLPCMDDLRLPRCLSPLESSTLATEHQPIFRRSANHSDKIQPLPSLHRPPWLTEKLGSLQYPLSDNSAMDQRHGSLPEDTNCICWAKRQQKDLKQISQNGGNWAESCEVTERRTIWAGHHIVEDRKSDQRKMKEGLKCKPGDNKADAARPKRRKIKHTSHLPDAPGSFVACKELKVSDGTKSQFSLSVCSVSLSSNNVLAKEREMATSSSNMQNKFAGKSNEPSNITESLKEKTRVPGGLTSGQTRIRTRGLLKKTQDNTSSEHSSGLKAMTHGAVKIVNKQGEPQPRRKRGRPPKTKRDECPQESSSTITEQKSDTVNREPHIDNNLPKEEEPEKTKRRCRKRRRNRSEVEVIPLKKTRSAESTGTTETDYNNDINPAGGEKNKWPRMVSLKEFQKLIKRQHSKTRTSKESQDKETNKTAKKVESEGKAHGSRSEELTTETEIGITELQKTEGMEESHDISHVTVDENHNQISKKSALDYCESQQDDTSSSTCKEASFFSDEQFSVFSFDVLGEEVAKLAAEREQPLRNPDEAQASDAAVSDTTQQPISIDGSSHSESDWFTKNSGCDQEEMDEEEEEVEVDVLLYSPDKGPQTRECKNGMENVDITPEEDDEEDVNEIDVTGDEAE